MLWLFRGGREGCGSGDEDDFILKVTWKLALSLWRVRGKAQETHGRLCRDRRENQESQTMIRRLQKWAWSEILESLECQAKEAMVFH